MKVEKLDYIGNGLLAIYRFLVIFSLLHAYFGENHSKEKSKSGQKNGVLLKDPLSTLDSVSFDSS